MKILIADDNNIVRRWLVTTLAELEGIEIAGEAADASSAVAAVRRLKPDAVILDYHMPGATRTDVLKEIKAIQPSIVVIMFTDYPYPEVRAKCIQDGADFVFDKSTAHVEMLGIVAEVRRRFFAAGPQAAA